MDLTASKWAGKRVFLTGHTGFKGGWTTVLLHRLGAEIHGFGLPPETNLNLFAAAGIETLTASSTIADIREPAPIRKAVLAANPDIVIHMAAQALVGQGYADPIGTYAANVMGTLHLFEAIRALERPIIAINVTSDKCYENHEWLWPYREIEPMGGHDPYSSSKGCAELLTAAYRASYFRESGVRLASVRAGNVIGGGDWSEARLIPDALRAFDAGRDLVLRAPSAIRPWQHVLEPVTGYLRLAEHLMQSDAFCEGWNFGPGDRDVRSVRWVIDRLYSHLGAPPSTSAGLPPYHEAAVLKLDSCKARDRLGWHPRWSVDTALGKTAEWHRDHSAREDMLAVCRRQIAEFQEAGA